MKKLGCIFFSLILTLNAFSYEVDLNKIESEAVIEFNNYVGPYLFYNTVDDIRNIGSYLASEITPGIKGSANYSSKYLIYHAPKLEWEESVNTCDIFSITENSYIDNIENIKLILSQYLIDNYGYSLDDSMLVAKLLVVYNAVYRGDLDHYVSRYTTEGGVVEDPNYLGIDINYYNWPGKTNIYIPLSEGIILGKLTNIDTDKIIDSDVIDHIKENEEDDINIREEIVDFKEREFDEVKEEIIEEKVELEDKKKQIEDELAETSDTTPEHEELKEELKEVEEELEIIKEKEEDLKVKEDKILEIRDELAEDKNKNIEENKQISNNELITFILNREVKGEVIGQILNIDSSGNIITSGKVNTIQNNNILVDGNYVYIIAGGNAENQIISLGKLDKSTLEVLFWGETLCYKNSPILSANGNIYIIVQIEKDYYIGEFGPEMKLLRVSPVGINKDSFMLIKDGLFYIQGSDNSIKLVNLSEFVPVDGD